MICGELRTRQVVATDFPHLHSTPPGVLDQERMPNSSTTVIALAAGVTQIVIANERPPEFWRNDPVLSSMTAAAKRVAHIVPILPRHFACDVPLVMNVESHAIGSLTPTLSTGIPIEAENLFPEQVPGCVAISIHGVPIR